MPHAPAHITCGLKTLLGGAEQTRVSWDLASVMCLGILHAAHELNSLQLGQCITQH